MWLLYMSNRLMVMVVCLKRQTKKTKENYKNNIYRTKVVIKNEAEHTILRGDNEFCAAEAKRQITQDCCSSLLLSHFWNTASLEIYSFFFLGFSNITFSIIFFSTKFCLRNEASIFLSRACLAPSFSFIISSVTLSFSLLDCKSSYDRRIIKKVWC